MQERSERTEADPTGYSVFSGAVNAAGSNDDVRNSKVLAILPHNLLLFDFREAISLATELGVLFGWTGLIQKPPPLSICIHHEGADEHEPPQAAIFSTGFEQVACGHNRIQKPIGKRLRRLPCCQMKDDRDILARSLTVFSGKKIPVEHLDARPCRRVHNALDLREFAGRPGNADYVPKATLQETFEHPSSYETCNACN